MICKAQLYVGVAILVLFSSCNKTKEKPEIDDTSLLKIPTNFTNSFTIPDDNQMNADAVNLGRFLFFDKNLSRDSSVSCASCHKPQKAFTDGFAKGIGIDGQQLDRSSMSLVNLLWRKRLMWDGRFESLEEQAIDPIINSKEMDLPISQAIDRLSNSSLYPSLFQKAFGSSEVTEVKIGKALAQFERTLISGSSKFDQAKRGEYFLSSQELRGNVLFNTHPEPGKRGGNCGDCHGGFLFMDQDFHNNGLDSLLTDLGRGSVTGFSDNNGQFKTTSLRNIALTSPYMHDGRFETLEEVLDHYNEHVQLSSPGLAPLIVDATNQEGSNTLSLTEQEKADIIAFLHTLTDNDFITNENFTNPFK
ncbi:MAG: cytochrome-c peroxidase [Cyclobacteriaceae bacterium]